MFDPELGVAIRLVKAFNEVDAQRITPFDIALVSCWMLGHTFKYNPGEMVCGVCGEMNESEEKE